MSSELKSLHPYLYRRVRLKGITFTLLGLALITPSHLPSVGDYINRNQADSTRLYEYVSYDVWGAVFVIIGAAVLLALAKGRHHRAAKPWLRAAALYATFWLVALIVAVATGNARSSSIVILWGYFTYNLWIVDRDSAWAGAELVKELRDRHNGS